MGRRQSWSENEMVSKADFKYQICPTKKIETMYCLQSYRTLIFFIFALKGLHLDEKTRNEVKAIKKEISDLGTNFGSNLNEDTTFVYFTEDELKGVPEDLIKSFEKVG